MLRIEPIRDAFDYAVYILILTLTLHNHHFVYIARTLSWPPVKVCWFCCVWCPIQEQRRREFVKLEKQLEDDQRQQALLAAQAAANKNHLVQFVARVTYLVVSICWCFIPVLSL